MPVLNQEILINPELSHACFYMGKMGKQDGRPGKSLGNPLNMLINFRVGGKKLGMVG